MMLTEKPTCANIEQKITPTHSPVNIKQNSTQLKVSSAVG
jgi:hypothetical protein